MMTEVKCAACGEKLGSNAGRCAACLDEELAGGLDWFAEHRPPATWELIARHMLGR